jgi:hypothetical protein
VVEVGLEGSFIVEIYEQEAFFEGGWRCPTNGRTAPTLKASLCFSARSNNRCIYLWWTAVVGLGSVYPHPWFLFGKSHYCNDGSEEILMPSLINHWLGLTQPRSCQGRVLILFSTALLHKLLTQPFTNTICNVLPFRLAYYHVGVISKFFIGAPIPILSCDLSLGLNWNHLVLPSTYY